MSTIKDVKELQVWKNAIGLTVEIYKITSNFPKSEQFGLTSQIQQAVVSIPSNIAEGFERNSDIDFKRFLIIARGSVSEVQTQLEIAKRLNYIKQPDFDVIQSKLTTVHKQINALIRHLRLTS